MFIYGLYSTEDGINRAIHLGKIRNFDFRMLISAKKEE